MADFANVAAIRGAKLSDLSQHVADVRAIVLDEADEYQVGSLVLDAYDFVPYALTGLAAAMQTPPAGQPRATTHVVVPVADDKGGRDTAELDVTLYGPGDVLGVDPGQIVRRYPAPGSTNAEETFHAHIEFDRPELPWAFSARTRDEQMRPWLALVVLERDEIEWEPAQAGLQPIMAVDAVNLPPLDDAWAWAHAQTVPGSPAGDPAASPALTARLSTAYAPVNVSRLLGSRVLRQHTNYVACLVPTTSAGVRAGLGMTGGDIEQAWSRQDGRVRLPVYDRWEFRTAPDGDFARLARRLEGVAAPWRIGRRTMDTSRPGDPLGDLAAGEQGRRLVVRCALYSPADRPADEPDDTIGWAPPRIADLRTALDRPAVVEGMAGTAPGAIPDLPIVGPRIYAKGQRGRNTIVGSDWFAELNLSPVHRVVAGLGTRVVVKDQEPLMQAAWAQVGEVEKANRALALAELARNLALSAHHRLTKVDPGRLLQLVRPMAARVRVEGNALTVAGQTARSATPTAALGGSFRRATRPTGPIARRLAPSEGAALVQVVATDVAARDFTRPYVELDGITGLSALAIESLSPDDLAVALRVAPGDAVATVQQAAASLATSATLATVVSTPSAWRAPDATFRPGRFVADRVAETLQRVAPVDPATDVVRARWVGGLAAGAATTRVLGSGADTAGTAVVDLALGLDTAVTAVLGGGVTGGGGVGGGGGVIGGLDPGRVVVGGVSGGIGGVISGVGGVGGIGGVVVRPGRPMRTAGAEMLRAGAARRDGIPTGLSEIAAGTLVGTISRPVLRPRPTDAGVVISDRERLDRFVTPQGTQLATWLDGAATVTVDALRAEVAALVAGPGALALAPTPSRDVLTIRRDDVLTSLSPARTVIGAMRGRVGLGSLAFDPFLGALIRPIMAAPRFDRPMYKALDDYDREWLVPGLTTLKEPELVTLLAMNDQFTEAFLVGLSDEMGRELLWRGYPTDSRGTYFHRFWNAAADELQHPIHRFPPTPLGRHVGIGSEVESGRAVVVVRGEVVRRYPDLTVWALKEQSRRAGDPPEFPRLPEAPKGMPDAAPSLFHAMLPPDILLAGLDITIEQLKTEPGWWIVLAEHPQATRFRRTEHDADSGVPTFGAAGANPSGAAVAAARLENPTRVAFEAADFLPDPKGRRHA